MYPIPIPLKLWIIGLNEKVNNENFLIAIAGNKCDLPPEIRKVSYNQGKDFANEKNVKIFLETSAKTGIGIQELFSIIAQKVYNIQKNE
jgi:GTPase SAR1 family protein